MTQKQLLSFTALTFLTVLSLSLFWEFALEDFIEPVFLPDHRLENLPERWESVIVSIGLIALALIVPTWLALKSNLARQQAEAALQESEARLMAIMDHAPIEIALKDKDGRYLFVNRQYEEKVGLPLELLMGRKVHDFRFPGAADVATAHDTEVLRTQAAVEKELKITYPNGTRTNLVIKFPIKDAAGDLVSIGSIDLDISRRREAEDALRKAHESLELQVEERTSGLRKANERLSREIADREKIEDKLRRIEERLRLITDALPVLISYVDKNLRYQFNNRAYETWFGISREDIRGRDVREVLGNDVYETLRGYVDRVLMGETVIFESTVPYKDGGERDIRGTYAPDFGQDGAVKGFYVLVEDITERKRLEQQLVHSERLATLGQLTGTVSHELRNPLGTIRNSLLVVDAKTRDQGLGVKRVLDRMSRSIRRCDDIIAELFDYATCRPVKFQDTSLNAWLAEVLDDHAMPKGVTVRLALGTGDTSVPMDRERMRRVIVNLCDNACQAMTDERDEERVDKERILTIGTEATGNEVKIFVTDTGTGMSKETVARIFEPLFSTKIFGVGLGLSIVKQIAEQHDGTIEVASEEGRGTRFVVRLPMVGAGGKAS